MASYGQVDCRLSPPGCPFFRDRAKLSGEDADRYDTMIKTVYNPATKERTHLLSIEYIKLIAKVEEIYYESRKKDLTDSGGNTETLGNTLAKMSKKNKLSPALTTAFGMRNAISRKVPSEIAK